MTTWHRAVYFFRLSIIMSSSHLLASRSSNDLRFNAGRNGCWGHELREELFLATRYCSLMTAFLYTLSIMHRRANDLLGMIAL
jgi:hypothetical protein